MLPIDIYSGDNQTRILKEHQQEFLQKSSMSRPIAARLYEHRDTLIAKILTDNGDGTYDVAPVTWSTPDNEWKDSAQQGKISNIYPLDEYESFAVDSIALIIPYKKDGYILDWVLVNPNTKVKFGVVSIVDTTPENNLPRNCVQINPCNDALGGGVDTGTTIWLALSSPLNNTINFAPVIALQDVVAWLTIAPGFNMTFGAVSRLIEGIVLSTNVDIQSTGISPVTPSDYITTIVSNAIQNEFINNSNGILGGTPGDATLQTPGQAQSFAIHYVPTGAGSKLIPVIGADARGHLIRVWMGDGATAVECQTGAGDTHYGLIIVPPAYSSNLMSRTADGTTMTCQLVADVTTGILSIVLTSDGASATGAYFFVRVDDFGQIPGTFNPYTNAP